MKENEYKILKDEFTRLTRDRDKLKKSNIEMETLKEIAQVRQYIELQRKRNNYSVFVYGLENKTDFEIVRDIRRNIKITPTTDIYYYVGSAMEKDDDILDLVDEIKCDAAYHGFYNIEEQYGNGIVSVVPAKLESFKASHIVVFPTMLRECHLSFNEASTEFLEIVLTEGEGKAIQKFKEYARTGYPWKIH